MSLDFVDIGDVDRILDSLGGGTGPTPAPNTAGVKRRARAPTSAATSSSPLPAATPPHRGSPHATAGRAPDAASARSRTAAAPAEGPHTTTITTGSSSRAQQPQPRGPPKPRRAPQPLRTVSSNAANIKANSSAAPSLHAAAAPQQHKPPPQQQQQHHPVHRTSTPQPTHGVSYAALFQASRMGMPLVQKVVSATGTGCCNAVHLRETEETHGGRRHAAAGGAGGGGVWSTNTQKDRHAECTLALHQRSFNVAAPKDLGLEPGTRLLYDAKLHIVSDNATPTIGTVCIYGGQHPMSGMAPITTEACFGSAPGAQSVSSRGVTFHKQTVCIEGGALQPFLRITLREGPPGQAPSDHSPAHTHRVVFATVVRGAGYRIVPPAPPPPPPPAVSIIPQHLFHAAESPGGGVATVESASSTPFQVEGVGGEAAQAQAPPHPHHRRQRRHSHGLPGKALFAALEQRVAAAEAAAAAAAAAEVERDVGENDLSFDAQKQALAAVLSAKARMRGGGGGDGGGSGGSSPPLTPAATPPARLQHGGGEERRFSSPQTQQQHPAAAAHPQHHSDSLSSFAAVSVPPVSARSGVEAAPAAARQPHDWIPGSWEVDREGRSDEGEEEEAEEGALQDEMLRWRGEEVEAEGEGGGAGGVDAVEVEVGGFPPRVHPGGGAVPAAGGGGGVEDVGDFRRNGAPAVVPGQDGGGVRLQQRRFAEGGEGLQHQQRGSVMSHAQQQQQQQQVMDEVEGGGCPTHREVYPRGDPLSVASPPPSGGGVDAGNGRPAERGVSASTDSRSLPYSVPASSSAPSATVPLQASPNGPGGGGGAVAATYGGLQEGVHRLPPRPRAAGEVSASPKLSVPRDRGEPCHSDAASLLARVNAISESMSPSRRTASPAPARPPTVPGTNMSHRGPASRTPARGGIASGVSGASGSASGRSLSPTPSSHMESPCLHHVTQQQLLQMQHPHCCCAGSVHSYCRGQQAQAQVQLSVQPPPPQAATPASAVPSSVEPPASERERRRQPLLNAIQLTPRASALHQRGSANEAVAGTPGLGEKQRQMMSLEQRVAELEGKPLEQVGRDVGERVDHQQQQQQQRHEPRSHSRGSEAQQKQPAQQQRRSASGAMKDVVRREAFQLVNKTVQEMLARAKEGKDSREAGGSSSSVVSGSSSAATHPPREQQRHTQQQHRTHSGARRPSAAADAPPPASPWSAPPQSSSPAPPLPLPPQSQALPAPSPRRGASGGSHWQQQEQPQLRRQQQQQQQSPVAAQAVLRGGAASNTIQTTASAFVVLKRLREELVAASGGQQTDAELAGHRMVLNPYCKGDTLATVLRMENYTSFVFTSQCFAEQVQAKRGAAYRSAGVAEQRQMVWDELVTTVPLSVTPVTRVCEGVVLCRAVVPVPGGAPTAKYFIMFHTAVETAVSSLKQVKPQFPWFHLHCLLDFERRVFETMIDEIVAMSPCDADPDATGSAGSRSEHTLVYYTDLLQAHPLTPFFGGLARGSSETFIWNDLVFSGECADGRFLKLSVRPHRAAIHYWQRGSGQSGRPPLGVLLVHQSLCTHLGSEQFDGIVLTEAEAAVVSATLPQDILATVQPRLHVVGDSFYAGDTQHCALSLLELCNANSWATVATTFFGGDDGLMDTIYEWDQPYPHSVNIFYTHASDFASIRDGFHEISRSGE